MKFIKFLWEGRKKVKYLINERGYYRSMSGNLCDSHGCMSIPIIDIFKMSWDEVKRF